MRPLRFLVKYFDEILSGTLLVLITGATFANVVARYAFNYPIMWAEEFARYTFIWVVFLGAVVCTKHRRHIVIDSLMLALPARLRGFTYVLVDAFTLGLMGVLAYYGWILTTFTTQPMSTLKVPMSMVYLVVPLSAVLIALRTLGDLASHLRLALTGDERR